MTKFVVRNLLDHDDPGLTDLLGGWRVIRHSSVDDPIKLVFAPPSPKDGIGGPARDYVLKAIKLLQKEGINSEKLGYLEPELLIDISKQSADFPEKLEKLSSSLKEGLFEKQKQLVNGLFSQGDGEAVLFEGSVLLDHEGEAMFPEQAAEILARNTQKIRDFANKVGVENMLDAKLASFQRKSNALSRA